MITNAQSEQIGLEKLLENKVSLEDVFRHPDYLDEVTYQNEKLYDFLSQKMNISKMLNYIFSPSSKD